MLRFERAHFETAGFEVMEIARESDVVGTRGKLLQVSSVPGAICCSGTEQAASETPSKAAIDALEFQNLDSEEDVCRICEERGNHSQQPLLQHCACKGSIGFVHKDCIEKWLDLSKATECEICKQDYPFMIPTFRDPPEDEEDYFLELRFELRYCLVPIVWVLWSHMFVVLFTIPGNGRSWITDGLLGSTIYSLFFFVASLIWLMLLKYVPGVMGANYVSDVYEGHDVWAAALNHLQPSNLIGDGLGDIRRTAFDCMLACKLYNIAIDLGEAAFNYMVVYLLYYIAVLGADMWVGDPEGTAHRELIYRATNNWGDTNSKWKLWRAICMILGLPVLAITLCKWLRILYIIGLLFF